MMETTLVETQAELPKREPWDRLEDEGESAAAYSRFLKFLHLGPRRSLLALHRAELAEKAALAGERPRKPDSTPSSLRALADRFDWWARASQFTLAQLAADKAAYAKVRRERVNQLLDREYSDSQMMLDVSRRALAEGHKFISRRVAEKAARIEIDPVSGEKIKVVERVVFLELKIGAINRMMMSGSRLARLSVGLTTPQAQEAFLAAQAQGMEPMDVEETDKLIYQWFEELNGNRIPPALPEAAPDDLDLPSGVVEQDGPTDGISPGGQV